MLGLKSKYQSQVVNGFNDFIVEEVLVKALVVVPYRTAKIYNVGIAMPTSMELSSKIDLTIDDISYGPLLSVDEVKELNDNRKRIFDNFKVKYRNHLTFDPYDKIRCRVPLSRGNGAYVTFTSVPCVDDLTQVLHENGYTRPATMVTIDIIDCGQKATFIYSDGAGGVKNRDVVEGMIELFSKALAECEPCSREYAEYHEALEELVEQQEFVYLDLKPYPTPRQIENGKRFYRFGEKEVHIVFA